MTASSTKTLTESDFVKQIIANSNALSSHLTKPSKTGKSSLGLDGYLEFYIFSVVVRAMKKKGFSCLYFNRDANQRFLVPQAGHNISSNFSYVKFVKPRCDEWVCKEAHISLFVKGASGVKQEADVCVLPIGNGKYYRNSGKTFECVQRNLSRGQKSG
ncbi:hypothetical protein [Deinococcus budaensis]|uniref:Uncharacterized protein n=1 Tax=Deinococcus budaensis TaxID=1665626 RepID=A0A7W8GIS4_9DEIO|nr:hypothetical protein [Deinococcus budaensis]MBB5236248.1 hypothetical protein [Deinococcus budaensis]